MSSPLSINVAPHERDRGAALFILCPHCQEVEYFHLVQIGSIIPVFKVFGLGTHWELRCAGCRYRHPLMTTELVGVQDLLQLTARLAGGTMEAPQYASRLLRSDLPCVRAIVKGSEAWLCPACHASVPREFRHCWRCQNANPDADPAEDQDDPEEPPWRFEDDGVNGQVYWATHPDDEDDDD